MAEKSIYKQINEEMEFLRNNGKPAFCLNNSFIRQGPTTYEFLVGVPSDVSSDNLAHVIVNKQRVQSVKESYESNADDDDKYGVNDPSYVIRIDTHKSLAVVWFNKDWPVSVVTHDADGNVQSTKMTGADIMKSHDIWLEDKRIERREQELREKKVDAEFGNIQSDEATSNAPQITED